MTEFNDYDHRQLREAHKFAYERIRVEMKKGEVPDELYIQLGRVCFEVMERQEEDNGGA